MRYVVLALLSAVSLKAAATEGVFLPGNGPIQRSRAGAGAASPRDASWMQLNPATITRLERRIDVGLDVLLSDVTLAPGGVIGNHSAGDLTDAQYFFIPSVGIIWPTDDAVFGFGLYAPSGIGVDYAASRDAISHFLQNNADRRLDYRHIRLIAACGHELRGGWSIGFNVNVSLSRFRTDSLTLRLVPTEGSNVWDDALGAGFSLGIYKVWDRLAFGASYQSRQWSQSFDRYADLLCSCLDLPQCVQLGVAYSLTSSIEIAADYKFIDWDQVAVTGKAPLAGGFGWEEQHLAKLGLEWRLNERLTARAGISHGNSPISEEHMFLNALVPVITKDVLAVGVSWAVDERNEVHLSFAHAFAATVTSPREGGVFSLLSAGTYTRLEYDALTVGYSHKF